VVIAIAGGSAATAQRAHPLRARNTACTRVLLRNMNLIQRRLIIYHLLSSV